MPRMAQQGTTSNLRRLAGRRSPSTGGPHIPLESSDYPPVLFRLPEVEVEQESESSAAAMAPNSGVMAPQAAPTSNTPTPNTTADSAEAGQNIFNHVAGAVTGAVAGTVANSVAVAGTLAGSALSATPFGTTPFSATPGTRPSFSSQSATLETPASARSTPVVRPIPESAENDSRSWWEHWSSGIILMLLILALVTAGIMAIRDPDQSRNTQRPIATDNKSATTPAKTSGESTAALKPANASEAKPVVADNRSPTPSSSTTAASTPAAPTASASLSPSLLPEAGSALTEANKSKVPSFTLGPNTQTSANFASQNNGSSPALVADSSGFVSSSQPSPGAAASQGSASRLAQEFANSNTSNGTPAISASTQIGKPQGENFEATVPANTPDAGSNAPNLSWPVDETETPSPANNQQSATADSSGGLKLSGSPTVTAPDLLPAEPTPAAPAPATTATPETKVAARPAYLETALPNEDLESILEMRRQAMASTRVVSNQYYPASSGAGVPATTAQPSATNTGVPTNAGMPTYNNTPSHVMPSNVAPTQPSAQYSNPQYQGQPYSNQQYQNQQYPNQPYPGQQPYQPAPTQPNSVVPPQQPAYSYMNNGSANMNGATTGAMNYSAGSATNVPSQAIGTRSWTYNPNTGTQNSWTLPAPGSVQPASNQNMSGGTQAPGTNAVPGTGGLQMDPNYARQLGYGQPTATAPSVSSPQSGWSNTAGQMRTPVANNPYGIVNSQPAASSGAPNIAAPSGSMMIPNPAMNQPNTQPMNYPNISAPNGYSTGTMR